MSGKRQRFQTLWVNAEDVLEALQYRYGIWPVQYPRSWRVRVFAEAYYEYHNSLTVENWRFVKTMYDEYHRTGFVPTTVLRFGGEMICAAYRHAFVDTFAGRIRAREEEGNGADDSSAETRVLRGPVLRHGRNTRVA